MGHLQGKINKTKNYKIMYIKIYNRRAGRIYNK